MNMSKPRKPYRKSPSIQVIANAKHCGETVAGLARRLRVSRRSIYSAIDRAAAKGLVAVPDVLTLFQSPESQRRLLAIMRSAHQRGVAIPEWELLHQARLYAATQSP